MPHNLSYPLNVEGDIQQGHYIMFFINATDPVKVERWKDYDQKMKEYNELMKKEFFLQSWKLLDLPQVLTNHNLHHILMFPQHAILAPISISDVIYHNLIVITLLRDVDH